MSLFRSLLHIPVRRHHGDFDDFFMDRWDELHPALIDDRRAWESRLDDMRNHFFHFSPLFGELTEHFPSTNTIHPGPTGNPEFSVRFNVKDFKPEEVKVSTKDGRLTVSASHDEQTEDSSSHREFTRTLDIPEDTQIDLMRSTLSRDGMLSVTAPIHAPALPEGEDTPALEQPASSSVVTREADTGKALNYSLSIAGYKPEEISVKVEGRKVTVVAKHDESEEHRKVHKEMTKSFDLPDTVDPHHVRSYIKDADTLFVEAQLRDDLAGQIHVVPVTHKPE